MVGRSKEEGSVRQGDQEGLGDWGVRVQPLTKIEFRAVQSGGSEEQVHDGGWERPREVAQGKGPKADGASRESLVEASLSVSFCASAWWSCCNVSRAGSGVG